MATTPPTTTNGTASAINTAIATAFSAAETGVENLILADIAALSSVLAFLTPIYRPVIDGIVGYVGSKFSVALQNAGTFTVIDVQVGSEKSGLSSALAALMAAEKSGDPVAIQKAIQAYADAQSALTHDDGSAPAQH